MSGSLRQAAIVIGLSDACWMFTEKYGRAWLAVPNDFRNWVVRTVVVVAAIGSCR